MFYILESVCSDYALASMLIILKRVLNFIQIFVPIILIISVVFQLIKKVLNPDDGGKEGSMKTIINSFTASLIVVFLPYIINLTMSTISTYGDVGLSENGTLSALNVTSCWQQAETKTAVLDSSMQSSSSTIDKEKAKNTVSLYDDSSYYEQLVKDYEKRKKEEGTTSSGTGAKPTSGMPIPIMYQQDYPDVVLNGSNTVSNAGCGWTACSMVATYLLNKNITPREMASWSRSYYIPGTGMSHALPPAMAQHYGLQAPVVTRSINEVVQALKNNQPVISAQSKGIFTSGGHLIVLRGVDSNGNIYVNDPNRYNAINKGYETRAFTPQEVAASGGTYWIFQRKD